MDWAVAWMPTDAQIPKGWRLARLGDVAEVVMGQSPPGELVVDWDGNDDQSSGLPFIQGNAEFGADFPSPVKWCTQPFKLGIPGDTLISVRAPVGETNKVGQKLGIGRGLAAVRFNKRSQAFGWHILNHAKKALERVAQGSTFSAIGGSELRSLPILLPPLPEQRAIAAVLDAIDAAIESAGAVIAATERLRDSLLHQLLSRGLPGRHTEWQEAPGLGTIPAAWQVVRLGEVAEVKGGKRLPKGESFAQEDTGLPYIRVVDFYNRTVNTSDMQFLKPEIQKVISRYTISSADVYISIAGTIGLVGTIPAHLNGANLTENAAKITDLSANRLSRDYLSLYLYSYYGQSQIKHRINALGQPKLALERIRTIEVPLPPLPEQQAIAELLDGVDETIAGAKKERDGLQLLKESTADALLTGRVRVGAAEGV